MEPHTTSMLPPSSLLRLKISSVNKIDDFFISPEVGKVRKSERKDSF